MRDLRLVGVHEDGHHLLLSDGDGGRYRVPLDEPLRAAARRDRPRLGQLQIEMDGGMRPREVQALIRAGLTTEEVADRAGWSVEKVRRYEGPILAERDHVATLARQVRLRSRGGNSSDTLGGRVAVRLTGRGVDPSVALWDSSRTEDGQWSVTVLFPAGGRERSAAWHVDLVSRSVTPRDDEARWLSGDDAEADGPIPAPHRAEAPVDSKVYDLDAEGGITGAPRRRRSGEDLVATMRETNARRRRRNQPTLTPVEDSAPSDALPLEEFGFDPASDAPPPPAGGTHPADTADRASSTEGELEQKKRRGKRKAAKPALASVPDEVLDDDPETAQTSETQPVVAAQPEPVQPERSQSESAQPEPAQPEPAQPEPSQSEPARPDATAPGATDTEATAPAPETVAPQADSVGSPAESPAAPTAKPGARRGRTSVPSWDDIMFGAKGTPTKE